MVGNGCIAQTGCHQAMGDRLKQSFSTLSSVKIVLSSLANNITEEKTSPKNSHVS